MIRTHGRCRPGLLPARLARSPSGGAEGLAHASNHPIGRQGSVARIARGILAEHFGDTTVFDPIMVVSKIDHHGDGYLHVYTAYDCDLEMLDPKSTLGFSRLMLPQLLEPGVETLPNTSFIQRDEWERGLGRWLS